MARRKKTQSEKRLGVIYARYSSHRQKDISIEQQIAECKAHAKSMGLQLVETYEDRAISGRTDKRPGFQRMMKDAEKGLFTTVVAWKSNRIGRNMLEAMMTEEKLRKRGVKIVYVEEEFDDSAAGRFALRSMMNVNQFYSENMAEDIRRGIRDNALNCKVANGALPLGYRVGKDLRWELDPPKDEYVREIYERVLKGERLIDIARDFNARGIPTSRGRQWSRASFNTLLHNERYTGVYIYQDIRIEGGVPRILSDELFWKVQEVMKTKKNPRGRRHRSTEDPYPLTGKLFCGKCGAMMAGLCGTSKTGAKHYYYGCLKKRTEHSCDKKNVRRDAIEIAVARAIQVHILTEDVIAWIADCVMEFYEKSVEEAHLYELEDQYKDVCRRLDNLLDIVENGGATASTVDRLKAMEQEKADLKHKIAVARADIIEIDRETVIKGLSMYKDGTVDDQQYRADLFETFLVAAYVHDDHLKIVFRVFGDNKDLELPFGLDGISDTDIVKSSSSCSRTFGPPNPAPANSGTTVYMFNDLFVLVCPLETAAK